MEINYTLTDWQVQALCKAYGKNREDLEDWEICELLDKLLDNLK